MKINKEEKLRIQKLYNLNEQTDRFDDYVNDSDIEYMDSGDDGEIERMFNDCLDNIKNMSGANPSKNVYLDLLDKYYGDNYESGTEFAKNRGKLGL